MLSNIIRMDLVDIQILPWILIIRYDALTYKKYVKGYHVQFCVIILMYLYIMIFTSVLIKHLNTINKNAIEEEESCRDYNFKLLPGKNM